MILLFKLTVTPVLILMLTLMTRRFGPAAGGILMGIPLTTGPISAFLAIQHGPAFATDAAVANLVGQLSTGLFCLTYALAAKRFGPITSALFGNAAFLGATLVWSQTTWSLWGASAVLLGGLAILTAVFPTAKVAPITRRPPRWELPLRMGVAIAFVLTITGLSPILAPNLAA